MEALCNWILMREGFRVSRFAWAEDAMCGRSQWDYDGTQYQHASIPRSYTAGGMSSEFGRRTALIIEHEKFTLLTSGIGDKTREQYMTCWRRWAQYSACMCLSPLV